MALRCPRPIRPTRLQWATLPARSRWWRVRRRYCRQTPAREMTVRRLSTRATRPLLTSSAMVTPPPLRDIVTKDRDQRPRRRIPPQTLERPADVWIHPIAPRTFLLLHQIRAIAVQPLATANLRLRLTMSP